MSADDLAEQAAARVREIIAEAEERAQEIIAQAEVEAASIRANADSQASTQLDRARSAMAELEGALGGLGSGLASKIGGGSKPQAEPVGEDDEVAAHPPTVPGPEEVTPAAPSGGGDSAARLVAMKMALEGSSRDEIEARLGDFDVAEPGPLLDDVMKRARR